MSYLLFAPDDVKALKTHIVPEYEGAIFGMSERIAILSAASDLSRETYVHTFGALGEGPECFPLWKRDQDPTPAAVREALLLSRELVAYALARCA